MESRVGIGYDLHRFGEGRRLLLGGVYFPGERGLIGHSDADPLTHAVIDALLGAANLGDIGVHFPPSDPRFAGADSLDLLRRSVELLTQGGWRIANVDATVIAERPRLTPYILSMREMLARAAGIEAARVSVKAKTNEGVGTLGAGEAIAALATALIEREAVGSG
ncbi:MAG: 2-C-methyl-D-erythritol 2,4-cyclodiphosphate synthase [Dehalococcoidia bacterium]